MGDYNQEPGVGYLGDDHNGDHDDYPDDSYNHGMNPFVIFLILILLLLGSSGFGGY